MSDVETWEKSGLKAEVVGDGAVEHFRVRSFMIDGRVHLHLIEDGVLVFRQGNATCFRLIKSRE